MDQVQTLLRKVFRGIGSSRARRYETLLARGEWALLQQQRLPPASTYQNAFVYRKDAMVTDIVRKLALPGNDATCTQAAIAKFWAAEAQCKATNDRLAPYEHGALLAHETPIMEFIVRWRREVRLAIGRLPEMVEPRFSRGSTLSDPDVRVTIPDKLSSKPTMYAHGEGSARLDLAGTPFTPKPWELVRANRFFTVPKDAQEHRGCCVEASIAVLQQLAYGKQIERNYERHYRVNLRRTPEYHRWLAAIASRFGTFATIDLSSASDTIATRLVRLLLPGAWYTALDSCRARRTTLPGKGDVVLEKFSSMGNGFTFPLETLLFGTLARTLGSRCSTVFGDDIIVETEHAPAMIAALRFFGFTPNARKTFCDGPFRESCGGDFFNGVPVRAHFLKELPSEPQHWVMIANGLRRWDPDLQWLGAAWNYCIDQLPRDWSLCRSGDWHVCHSKVGEHDDFADLAIYDPSTRPVVRDIQVQTPSGIVKTPMPCWRVKRAIQRKYSLDAHFGPDVRIIARTLGCEAKVSVRGPVKGYANNWIPCYGTGWLPGTSV